MENKSILVEKTTLRSEKILYFSLQTSKLTVKIYYRVMCVLSYRLGLEF